jgi:hypothetical protein
MLYAAYRRTMLVKSVQVPKVRALRSLAADRVRSKPRVSWLGLGGGAFRAAGGPQ